jgi:hypothetical protein
MKQIIFENKFKSFVDRFISKLLQRSFGELTHSVSDDGYHSWVSDKWSRNIPYDKTPNRPFHKNLWGTLWIEGYEFYDDLMSDLSIFGFNDEQKEQVFIDYMNDKYGTDIKKLGVE